MELDLRTLIFQILKGYITRVSYLHSVLKYFKLYKNIKLLKGTKRGKNVIVVGNGPSLDKLPEKFLMNLQKSGFDIFAVNYFYNSRIFNCIYPNFYFSTDPDAINESSFKEVSKILNNNLSTTIFTSDYMYLKYQNAFPNHQIYGMCDLEIRRKLFKNRTSISPILPRSYVSMTAYKALAVAAWLEYENIYLIGIDNTYFSDVYCLEDNSLLEKNLHAGGVLTEIYLGSKYKNIYSYFHDCSLLFNDLYKFPGYNVFNLDKNSLIDAFKKIDHKTLLSY